MIKYETEIKEETKALIEQAIEIELESAKAEGEFEDILRAYIILKKKLEDAREMYRGARGGLHGFWAVSKRYFRDGQPYYLKDIRKFATLAMQELAQLAAHAQKALDEINKEKQK